MSKGLDNHLNVIRQKIYDNQTLCKLLYYDNSNPLAEVDLADTSILWSDLENQRLYFTPFTIDTSDVRKSKLYITHNNFSLGKNVYYDNLYIKFIVMVHNYLWEIIDGSGDVVLRPNLIVDELNTMFNRQRNLGIGRDFLSSGNIIYPNKNFSGYELIVKYVDFTVKE